ncbi:hypothetical protein [Lacunimicrobium album]
MSTTLESDTSTHDPIAQMRLTMCATRLSFTWLGVRKSLSAEQTATAADQFEAEAKFVSARKKLLDTNHPKFKAVTGIKGKIQQYWKSLTLPYPEPGVRLIKHIDLEPFQKQMERFQQELRESVQELDDHFEELKRAARIRLGQLFDSLDYPAHLWAEFQVSWDFPSVEPPDYLRRLNPELYQRECRRVADRFDQAVELAETAFIEEFHKLLTHLTDRLSGNQDGKPKVFRDSAVDKLREFFERFKKLNLRSNEELDNVIHEAESILDNIPARSLRQHDVLRQEIAGELSSVQHAIDNILIDRPRRQLLRQTPVKG